MKILYITRVDSSEKTGASIVANRNLNALRDIVGNNNVVEFHLNKTSIKNVALSLLSFCSYGITIEEEKSAIEIARKVKPDFVFMESSSYGSLVKRFEKNGFRTICFAHNLDTELCRQELKSRSLLISWPKYLSTRYNEQLTSKYAGTLICLNKRDSEGFYTSFGRKADIILPITFPEKKLFESHIDSPLDQPYYLFVGSDFFPNVEGIYWFIKEVAPYVNYNFRIVGSCCKNKKFKEIDIPSNVILVGYSNDIESEYEKALGVIAPIFKGSGMKTKTIEALSYGKYIYGTSEAFEGVDVDYNKIGGLCNNASDFITALQNHNEGDFNEYTHNIFRDKYSDQSFKERLSQFLSNNATTKN